jgi:RimJ/RimL family protein N-acetyltransferase
MKDLLRDNNKKKLILWTQEYNKRAQRCYLRNGFKIIRREKAEVNGGEAMEDFLVMECDL